MSAPRIEPLGLNIDLRSRQVQLLYNVRYFNGSDDVLLATEATAAVTLLDERWEQLEEVTKGIVGDLLTKYGLSTAEDLKDQPLDGDWDQEEPLEEDDQEL